MDHLLDQRVQINVKRRQKGSEKRIQVACSFAIIFGINGLKYDKILYMQKLRGGLKISKTALKILQLQSLS